jgi:hypothetical protein
LTQAVAPAVTTTTLAVPTGTWATNQPLNFTATVGAASGGVPTGSVLFTIDGGVQTFLQPLNSGKATLNFPGFTDAGPHSIVASFVPDSPNFASSASALIGHMVLGSSLVTLSVTSESILSSQISMITVTVVGMAATPTGLVNFYDGTTLIGTCRLDPTGKASLNFTSVRVGSHSITAAYLGDAENLPSTSAIFGITVLSPANGRLVGGNLKN